MLETEAERTAYFTREALGYKLFRPYPKILATTGTDLPVSDCQRRLHAHKSRVLRKGFQPNSSIHGHLPLLGFPAAIVLIDRKALLFLQTQSFFPHPPTSLLFLATLGLLWVSSSRTLRAQAAITYYGLFVTGASTEASLFADYIVFDQNAQVFAPKEAIGGRAEDAALSFYVSTRPLFLVEYSPRVQLALIFWDWHLVTNFPWQRQDAENFHRRIRVSRSLGLFPLVCGLASEKFMEVLTTVPHSSSVIGLGTNTVISLPLSADRPWRFDLNELERKLSDPDGANIIAISAREVNIGRFATSGEEMLNALWPISMARGSMLMERSGSKRWRTLSLATPINSSTFHTTAVYFSLVTANCSKLSSRTTPSRARHPISEKLSAHNLGVENSRHLHALPVYASLLAYGRVWHRDLLERQIELSRTIAAFIEQSEHYELLPKLTVLTDIYIIVLFRHAPRH
ncbi:hypothetical protein C8F04DRAFT_1315453 [Mycena alexandri]|uniref:Uncharacterized protein n=1 Tax=Mycena alexandri TaxID=1745969 RepID=A0AAD6S4P1_9AGAR|nr:hypothetical protein C8F04DRAFT_1315453 [Mycena alexandri]